MYDEGTHYLGFDASWWQISGVETVNGLDGRRLCYVVCIAVWEELFEVLGMQDVLVLFSICMKAFTKTILQLIDVHEAWLR